MKPEIFREYDIRGIVGAELSLDQVYPLGQAIAAYLHDKAPEITKIAVGRDGRVHSPDIFEKLTAALSDSGFDVYDIGVCPSPVLYFAMHTESVEAGIMITASHNPGNYNGFKICLGTACIWGEGVREIGRYYARGATVKLDRIGVSFDCPIIPKYVHYLANAFKHVDFKQLPVILDCGNGAGGTVMPELKKALQWNALTLLFAEVDGTYPNHEADPVVLENMREVQQLLRDGNYAFGAGLDGDCDRMAVMTPSGHLVSGDRLLALFAHYILENHPHAPIVVDIKSSSAVTEMLHQWGAQVFVSPTGHAIVKEEMQKNHSVLGGELSCHFFFKDRYFGYDDGIYALLRVCELLQQSHESLETMLQKFPHRFTSREYRIACPEDKKREIVEYAKKALANSGAQLITIDGVKALWPDGWGIVRAANTQPAITLRFEGNTQQALHRVQQEFYTVLQSYIPADALNVLAVRENA